MTDLTADQLVESWRTEDCDYCAQTVNHRCRTKSGALCPPHASRRVKYASRLNGRADRQPEVDDLTGQVTNLRAVNDQLSVLDAAKDDKLDMATQRLANLQLDLTHTQADLAAALARIAELEDPPPPEPTVLFTNPGKRVLLPAGKRGGGAGSNATFALSAKADDITVTYEVMFEQPFDWHKAGKLPGPVAVLDGVSPTLATGGKEFGDQACSGRLMWMDPNGGTWTLADGTKRKAVAPAEIIGYPYHPGQADNFGDNVWTGFAPPVGEFFTVEAHYVMNTPGKADGVFAINLDGGKQVEGSGFVWRSRADLHWSHFLESVFPGGGNDTYAAPVDRHITVRNIRVTTPA